MAMNRNHYQPEAQNQLRVGRSVEGGPDLQHHPFFKKFKLESTYLNHVIPFLLVQSYAPVIDF